MEKRDRKAQGMALPTKEEITKATHKNPT